MQDAGVHLLNSNGGAFSGEEGLFVPFQSAINAEQKSTGSTSCFREPGPGYRGLLESECVWIQFWFELQNRAERPGLDSWLTSYVQDQRRHGRFERPVPNQTFDVPEWVQYLDVVPKEQRAAAWIAVAFLFLCSLNTTGLLIAKFSNRGTEVGVRRAVGATRKRIFFQFLAESSVVGLVGGVLGVGLSLLGLWAIRQAASDLSLVTYMDGQMLSLSVLVALCASCAAGVMPAWKLSAVPPSLQIRSQ